MRLVAKHGYPQIILYFGHAPGDDLLCTTVLRELRTRGYRNLWMVSNHPEIFQGMEDATCVLPLDLPLLRLRRFHHLEYARWLPEEDRSVPPQHHIIAELCTQVGITGDIELRPHLRLTSTEHASGFWANGKIAIQSSGLGGILPMKNKQWYPERFQEVVDQLYQQMDFVQIGSLSDPPLTHALDLRGKTTIRETAAILSNTRLYIGNVGFLMHLARAVECPAVILFGGREAPWQSGYSENTNLYTSTTCSPCWLWNTCEYGKKCMEHITSTEVIQAILAKLAETKQVRM